MVGAADEAVVARELVEEMDGGVVGEPTGRKRCLGGGEPAMVGFFWWMDVSWKGVEEVWEEGPKDIVMGQEIS